MWRDNYTNFSFDDQDSENFKVWITNKNDLKQNMSPSFSDKFNIPTYGQIRYHEGTTIDKQDFKFSCVAVDVTLNEWRAITEWLSPLKSGKLRFDWNDKYYYMVKLSNAPEGTIFVRNRVDSIMGQLYIITFTLQFTTISDWAALSDYSEQNNSWNNDNELQINPSVYNNNYYMPSVVLTKERENEINLTAGQFIYGAEELTLDLTKSSLTVGEDPFAEVYNSYNEKIGELILKDNDTILYGHYYTENNVIKKWESEIEINYGKSTIGFNPLYYLVFISKGDRLNVTQKWASKNLINNFSSLDVFPIIYTKGTTSITWNNRLHYHYSLMEPDSAYKPWVVINTRSSVLESSGQNISLLKDTRGLNVFDTINLVNEGPLNIQSGRPELIKGRLYQIRFDENLGVNEIVWKINNQPIYNRYKDLMVHIFSKEMIDELNEYNKSLYGNEIYSINNESYKHLLLYNPIINYERVDGGWLLKIRFNKNSNVLDDYTNVNWISGAPMVNNTMYISLCDTVNIDINADDFAIGCQGREVI